MDGAVLSVTELNNHIKNMLDSDPLLQSVAVRGELSNYKVYPSGHHYFTLKDPESALRCVMFRGNASRLHFKPASGMGVTAVGRLSVYPRDGAYQLYVEQLLPEGTGDLALAFEQLKEKLQREGLFDPAHKNPIPRFPQTIAVVTSSAGAAVRDIIRVLGKRWPAAKVVLLPVRVQGTEAPPEIVGAIRYANKYRVGDVLIVGRGGGSIEDLWAFNDERVARAIFDSDIPVISAVGHEPDFTIADFVADLRAATPSNAAELAVPDEAEQRELLENLRARAGHAAEKELSARRARLEDMASRRVVQNPAAYIDQKRLELDGVSGAMLADFERLLTQKKAACQRLSSALPADFDRLLAEKKNAYGRTAATLDALSPLKVLGRGYAIAEDAQGAPVSSVRQLQPGDTLELKLSDGSASCAVESVKKERKRRLSHGTEENEL